MNSGGLLANLREFATTLSLYEYLGFALSFLIFLIIFFMAIGARNKPLKAVLYIFLSFLFLGISPIAVKKIVNSYFKTLDVQVERSRKLQYIDTVIIDGSLTNTSGMNYKRCIITAKLTKKSSNSLRQQLFALKPLRSQHEIITEHFPAGESMPYKIVIDHFAYTRPFATFVSGECW